MKKTVLGLVLVLMTLGCTGTTDTGGGAQPTETILSLELGQSSIAPDFSTTAISKITNNWVKDIETGQLTLLPGRTDVTYDLNPQTINNVIKDTVYTAYTTVTTLQTTPANTYEIYGRFCFDYSTDGQQNVVVYTGESETLPTNSYTTGPLSIAFEGTKELNTQTQSRMTLMITITNIGRGTLYNDWTAGLTSDNMNRLTSVTITVPDEYLEVDEINYFTESGGTAGVDKIFVWDGANVRMVQSEGTEKLQITVPMELTTVPTDEIQRSIKITADYSYCVNSNVVSLTVLNQ